MYRAQTDTSMSENQSETTAGASNMPEVGMSLGPEALRMKEMAEAMNLSKFEMAQLIAQGAKIDRDVELKRIEIQEAIKSREASLQAEQDRAIRDQDRWERFIDRDNAERENFRATMSQMRQPPRATVTDSFRVKIPPFDEREDIDEYLTHFELICTANEWSRDFWAVRLLPLLKGAARDAVKNLSQNEVGDYDVMKRSLLFKYRKTSEHFRLRFRGYQPKQGETFEQAGEKMRDHARKWIKMQNKNPDDIDDVWDCFMQEASYNVLGGGDLEIKVREREPKTYTELMEAADLIAEAKRLSLEPRM